MKKLRLILFVALCLYSLGSFSQIIFTSVPVSNPTTLSDLWSLNISVNPSHHYFITLTLTDDKSNQLLLQKSRTFSLSGSELITTSNAPLVKAVTTVSSSADFLHKYNSNYQSFPLGRYEVTFKLYDVLSINEPVAEASYPIDNSFNQNLIQITPSNGEVLEDLLPNLSWKLVGADVKPGCSFQLTVKEILNGQTASDAMLNNQVFFTLTCSSESYLYGIADRQLNIGSSYVWTVTYSCNNKAVLNSEFWTFTIKDNLKKPTVFLDPNTFYRIQETEDGAVITVKDNYLKMKFVNTYPDKDGLLSYKVIDDKGKSIFTDKDIPLKLNYGENRYIIGLCPSTGYYLKPGRYKLVVTNDNEKKFYLNFLVKPDNSCE